MRDLEPLAYNQREAAAVLGVGTKFFRKHVEPAVRIVYIEGQKRYLRSELERWLDEAAV